MQRTRQLHAVFLTEFLNAASSVHDFLFACVERMAQGAYLDVQILTGSRTCFELVTATASHVNFGVAWMNISFHVAVLSKVNSENAQLCTKQNV
jgi:hypothetical protein